MNGDIINIRKMENKELVQNLKSMFYIISKKCNRCETPSCMGCVFSHGEMMGDIKHMLELMYDLDSESTLDVFDMDNTQWNMFLEDI